MSPKHSLGWTLPEKAGLVPFVCHTLECSSSCQEDNGLYGKARTCRREGGRIPSTEKGTSPRQGKGPTQEPHRDELGLGVPVGWLPAGWGMMSLQTSAVSANAGGEEIERLEWSSGGGSVEFSTPALGIQDRPPAFAPQCNLRINSILGLDRFVRNAETWSSPQTDWVTICTVPGPLGDLSSNSRADLG